MRKLVVTLALLLGVTVSHAQGTDYFVSTNSGDWNTASTWDVASVPPSNQTGGNDHITIDENVTLTGDLSVKSGTVLIINVGDTLTVNGNAQFNNGCSLIVNGVLIINGNVTNNNNSDDVIINGTIGITGDYDGGTGSAIGGTGNMDIDGSVTTSGDGTVFGSQDDCTEDCDNSANNPLPIELAWFYARDYEANTVIVEWVTLSEINNDYFVVEKSYDHINWFSLDTLDGMGNTSVPVMYAAVDTYPREGQTYYRLHQYDYDGENKLHPSIINEWYPPYSGKYIRIYPNPTPRAFSIQLCGFENEEVLIVVTDIHGKILFEKTEIAVEDSVITTIDSELPSGIYTVVGSNKDELYRKKIIIK